MSTPTVDLRVIDFDQAYAGKTVLVTGGAGAIGSNLVRALSAHVGPTGRVIVLDNLVSSPRWNVPSLKNVMFVEGDILDEVKLKRCFFEKPDIIVHLAAFFANQNSVDHPENDLMVNGMGTLRLTRVRHPPGLQPLRLRELGLQHLRQLGSPPPAGGFYEHAPHDALPDHQDAG
jgi:NAD(P)-dependent dehydrogenase (short-subunit alcohol dehydrogenase family)